jgi:hypothetical protein
MLFLPDDISVGGHDSVVVQAVAANLLWKEKKPKPGDEFSSVLRVDKLYVDIRGTMESGCRRVQRCR